MALLLPLRNAAIVVESPGSINLSFRERRILESFLYSPPLPRETFLQFVERHRSPAEDDAPGLSGAFP
jgi:hypothetical protein